MKNSVYFFLLLAVASVAQSGTQRSALERVLARDPQDLENLLLLAQLEDEEQNYDASQEAYRKLLSLDPWDDEARMAYAQVLIKSGRDEQANAEIATVRARHPTDKDLLSVSTSPQIQTRAKRPSPWGLNLRAGAFLGFDSNLPRLGENATRSNVGGALSGADVFLGGRYRSDLGDTSLFLNFRITSALSDIPTLNAFAPSHIEGGIRQDFRLNTKLRLAIDLRYRETFAEVFAIHRLRTVSPTLFAQLQTGPNTLRLLFRAPFAQPDGIQGFLDTLSPGLYLRDTLNFKKVRAGVDLGLYQNVVFSGTPTPGVAQDFQALSAAILVETFPKDWLDIFANVRMTGRRFLSTGLSPETTWNTTLGLRFHLTWLSIHTEYSYSRNLARGARNFSRHVLSAGLRFWYQK